MTVVEIIIAELHCLSNGGHRVDCSVSYVSDGLTKNKENLVCSGSMFRDQTESTLFRAGTVPETVPVRSLLMTQMDPLVHASHTHVLAGRECTPDGAISVN